MIQIFVDKNNKEIKVNDIVVYLHPFDVDKNSWGIYRIIENKELCCDAIFIRSYKTLELEECSNSDPIPLKYFTTIPFLSIEKEVKCETLTIVGNANDTSLVIEFAQKLLDGELNDAI